MTTPQQTARNNVIRSGYLGVVALLCACAAPVTDESVAVTAPSFEEYLQSLPRLRDTGAYIVEGDIAILDVERVRDFYEESISASALTIDQLTGPTADNKYPPSRRLNLTYCVSNRFDGFFSGINYKAAVVAAMNTATANWEDATRFGTRAPTINFIHITGQDATCTAANPNVFFNVEPGHIDGGGIAAAFKPDEDDRLGRRLVLDDEAIDPLDSSTPAGVLRHELGHVLGFRHEHTRHPRRICPETDAPPVRGISPYEALSVMHYRGLTETMCSDDGSRDFILTEYDRASVRCIYTVTSTEVETADACKGTRISGAANQFTGDWNGNVYRLNTVSAGVISRFTSNPPLWSTLSTQPGTRSILAGGSALYKIRNSDGAFSRWSGSAWTALPAFGASVVIGYRDGAAYRLAADGTIGRMAPTATSWTTILSTTASGRSLFRGLSTVFRRDSNGSIHRWSSGTTWIQVTASGSSVAQDAVGRIYTLDSGGTARLISGGSSSVIGTNMTRLRGGLETLYASQTSSPDTVRRWRGSTNWADHALNVSQFFSAGTRKLARMSGTGGTVSGELYDYLYPTQ